MYSSGVSFFFHSSSERPIGFFTRLPPSAARSGVLGGSGLGASAFGSSAGGASGFGAHDIPRARIATRAVVFMIIILGTRERTGGFYQNARGEVAPGRPVSKIIEGPPAAAS